MNYFDLHCDTISAIYCKKTDFNCKNLAFSFEKVQKYARKYQVFAFWSDNNATNEECFDTFLRENDYLEKLVTESGEKVQLCTEKHDLKDDDALHIIKAVEGGRLLCESLAGVEALRRHGVRILLPMWQGQDFIGGSWDTDTGLSDFGKKLIPECEKNGIIIDTSHMSEKSFYDTLKIASNPIIASHSNSRTICRTPRNLTDDMARQVVSSGGVVGVSLAAKHVSEKYFDRMPQDNEDFVLEVAGHILHYVEILGDRAVCLGCDFDGTERTVQIPDVSYIDRLRERLGDYLSTDEIENIFFNNAYNFFKINL